MRVSKSTTGPILNWNRTNRKSSLAPQECFRMSLKKNLALAAVSLSFALGSPMLHAQGIITGSLTGTVLDPTGAVVPGATIKAVDPATGVSFTVKSSGSGEFNFSNLPVGIYKVTISSPGFGDLDLKSVSIETGKSTGLGIERLATGSTVETLEVSTAQNLLETTQAQVTTTFDSAEIQNLPTGGGFDELALLIPGVVSSRGNSYGNSNGARFSSNGQRSRSNNFEIDGQSNNDNSVTGPQVFFSNPDAIQEIQVITNNFSAQYGRDAGSVVNYITKSGTNAIHGTAFEYYDGSWLTSLTQGQKGPQFGFCTPAQAGDPAQRGITCTVPKVPRSNNNHYGGTLGGPILKDKLFAFGSAEFAKLNTGTAIANSATVGSVTGYTPTQAGLAVLASAFPTNPGIQSLLKFGPYNSVVGTLVPIPGTTQTVPISDGTTTAQVPVSLYQRSYQSAYNTDEEILGRMDYQATGHDRFFLRYFYQAAPTFNSAVSAAAGQFVTVNDAAHSVGADWAHTFGARAVNTIRYSFQQTRVTFDGGGFPSCTVSNLAGCPAQLSITSTAATRAANGGINPISSFGLSSSYPQGRIVKDTQIQDNFNLTIGKHSMTMGGSFEYQNSPNVFLPNISGSYNFTGSNGLLTDTLTSFGLAVGNANVHFTEPDWAAYFQDDWKVTPALTLNMGVRWEYFSQSINLLNKLSVANQTGPTPLWNTALPLSVTTFPSTKPDYKHFEPRFGFAYNPAGLKSLVVRGGYAINIAPAFYNIFLNSYGSAPVVLSGTIAGCNNTTKLCIPQGGATYTSVHALDNQYLLPAAGAVGPNPGNYNQTFVAPDFRQPITQTYQIGIQQEIGRIAVVEVRYVGAHTSGDFQSTNGNPYIAQAVAAFPNYPGLAGSTPCAATTLPTNGVNPNIDVGRAHCGQGLVRNRVNTAFEVYNGLQTSLTTKAYRGLTATLGYTYARTIDNSSEIFGNTGTEAGGVTPFSQNPLDTNVGERGVSANSEPNVTSLGMTYVDPHFKQNHSFIGKVLGGFQLNTIYLFNSGQPQTLFQLSTNNSFCDTTFNANFGGTVDSCRPILSNPKAPFGSVGVNTGSGIYKTYGSAAGLASPNIDPNSVHWLINNQAEAIRRGTPYPGIGRNTVRGGSYNNLDASVFKNNKLTERINMQLQATFFNALNRAYYGAFDGELEDSAGAAPTFGNFNGNGGSNRTVQIGARLLF